MSTFALPENHAYPFRPENFIGPPNDDQGKLFIASSPRMREIRSRAELVAAVDVPVLLLGETGTGKEVVARHIHSSSPRSQGTFLKVNCAAVPAELLESELFGYEAGAFTGATRSKPGQFQLCEGGTLFLDEIGELAPRLQAKLLHALQDKAFYRLGGRAAVAVDVRVLAATNVEIGRAIIEKKLREDLYYRLSAFTLHLPPLRERKEEIPLLIRHFMNRFSLQHALQPRPFSPALMEACLAYTWPGNIRELENLVRRYLVLGDEDMALAELSSRPDPASPELFGVRESSRSPAVKSGLKSLVRSARKEVETEAILEALERTNWNRTVAARVLNISYRGLRHKMAQYGIGCQQARDEDPAVGSAAFAHSACK
ncbi:MAG: sigma-54 interaction domain-containing protein [Terriglobia bacterium]